MKFNIAYPINGTQKCIEIDDDQKCSIFYDKKLGAEIEADALGEQFKGYILKIGGGNDKDGFPMKQGVLVKGRVRLMMSKGTPCYRPRREGERKRKSVRGAIVGQDIRALHLVIVKKGEKEIEGLTDAKKPRTLGPKRVSKIRKLFALKKEDGATLVRKAAVRRTFTTTAGKKRQKAPKIQRLVTDERLRRKKIYKKEKKARWENTRKAVDDYNKFLIEWKKKRALKHQKEEKKAEEEKKPETTQKKDIKGKDTKEKPAQATKPAATQPKTTDKAPAPKKEAKKEAKKETKKEVPKEQPKKDTK